MPVTRMSERLYLKRSPLDQTSARNKTVTTPLTLDLFESFECSQYVCVGSGAFYTQRKRYLAN